MAVGAHSVRVSERRRPDSKSVRPNRVSEVRQAGESHDSADPCRGRGATGRSDQQESPVISDVPKTHRHSALAYRPVNRVILLIRAEDGEPRGAVINKNRP